MDVPERSYLVCASARTGSTLVCETLSAIGIAGHPKEYFIAFDKPRDAGPDWRREDPLVIEGNWEESRLALDNGVTTRQEFLALVYQVGSTPNGVFGAKIMGNYMWSMYDKFLEMPQFEGMSFPQILAKVFPGMKVLHLFRRDRLRQAVSWLRARQISVWHMTNEETGLTITSSPWPSGMWHVRKDRDIPLRLPRYDYDYISGLIQAIDKSDQNLKELYADLGVTPLEIAYEDLVADESYESTMRSILEYLDLDTKVQLPPKRTKRQADELNEEWVRRFLQDEEWDEKFRQEAISLRSKSL